MPDSALVALAILKVNWDLAQKDYIENFVPLVAECVRLAPHNVVTLPTVQALLRSEFGLDIPQNAIKTILGRLQRHGYVGLDKKAYIRNPGSLADLKICDVRNKVVGMYDAFISALASYAVSELKISIEGADAERALEEFLKSFKVNGGVPAPLPQNEASGRCAYIVGKFLEHAEQHDKQSFETFETIVQGNMLATAMYLPDPSQAQRKFRNTEVYFDTGFLISALGHAGRARKEPCLELTRLLRSSGAELRCFRHTFDEVQGALAACAERFVKKDFRDSYGPSMEYFLTQNYSASDIELLIVGLERDLQRLGVRISDKPEYRSKYQIDEAGLSKALDAKINYSNLHALRRDVDSVAAIMRLRAGEESIYIEESRALFVTTNAALSRIAKSFLAHEVGSRATPTCVNDHTLTYLMWLKTPQAAPDLPRKRIIADAYAATQPNERMWRAYLAEIDKLEKTGRVTKEDYYLLRHSLEAKSLLMDFTSGNEEAITEGTVEEVLQTIRRSIESDLEARIESERTGRLEAEATAKRVNEESARAMQERANKLRLRANAAAHVCTRGLEIIAIVLLFVGTLSTLPWGFPTLSKAWLRYGLTGLQAALLVLTVAGMCWGTQVKQFLVRLEARLVLVFERFLRDLSE